MNFCTKCESYYQQPGTCNCFAPQQQAAPAPICVPYTPLVTPHYQPNPMIPGTIYVGDPAPGTSFTITCNRDGAGILSVIDSAMRNGFRSSASGSPT